jgi:hypothetical protein
MTRIVKIAVKPRTGALKTAPIGKSHADIGGAGQHGFITNTGDFVGRTAGARIAKAAKQVPAKIKQLHSHHLKK